MSLCLKYAAVIGIAGTLIFGTGARAAELKVLSANGMQTVMEELVPKFERATGHKLSITFDTGGSTIKRARSESADVVVAIREGIDGLAKEGRVAADTVKAIASTGISVAVRKGAPKPDIGSPEAFKRTLLSVLPKPR